MRHYKPPNIKIHRNKYDKKYVDKIKMNEMGRYKENPWTQKFRSNKKIYEILKKYRYDG